jgi:hypothetical protein
MAFKEKSEMFDGKESGQEFSVKSGISVAGFFLEKKERGCQEPFGFCWRTAPTWEFEASVARERRAVGSGCFKGTAVA